MKIMLNLEIMLNYEPTNYLYINYQSKVSSSTLSPYHDRVLEQLDLFASWRSEGCVWLAVSAWTKWTVLKSLASVSGRLSVFDWIQWVVLEGCGWQKQQEENRNLSQGQRRADAVIGTCEAVWAASASHRAMDAAVSYASAIICGDLHLQAALASDGCCGEWWPSNNLC